MEQRQQPPPQRRTLQTLARALFGDYAELILGNMCAVNPRTIGRWMSGRNQLPPHVVDKIRDVLAIAQRNLAEQQQLDIARAAERERPPE